MHRPADAVQAGALERITAKVRRYPDEPDDVGNLLLSRASDEGTDLLVMGCYGHGRLRELILGGTMRAVLRSMTCPVLMAHRAIGGFDST